MLDEKTGIEKLGESQPSSLAYGKHIIQAHFLMLPGKSNQIELNLIVHGLI